jgi:hypothetical protein
MHAKGRHVEATQTHCKHGHPLEGENLYRDPKGHRYCRTCARDRQRRHALRHLHH